MYRQTYPNTVQI